MPDTLRDKLLFHASAALLNAAVLLTLFFAHAIPLLKPEPALAIAPVTRAAPAPSRPKVLSGIPIRVVVPSQNIDLAVNGGTYDSTTATWTLGNDRAYYATPTVPVNDSIGTTLIYGHNIPAVFGLLHTVAPGAAMQIYTDNGLVFHYQFQSAQEVTPDSVYLVSHVGEPSVMLQTCSGNWSEWRKLFSFQLVRVEKQSWNT